MHDNATDLIQTLRTHPWIESGFAVGPFSGVVQYPIRCLADVPGRSRQPAEEMMDGLRAVALVWNGVRESGEYHAVHFLGNHKITERIKFDQDVHSGSMNCEIIAQHFETDDLNLVAPGLLVALLAHLGKVPQGRICLTAGSLSRVDDRGPKPIAPSADVGWNSFPLTTDLDRWIVECRQFCDEGLSIGFTEKFFRKVAGPLLRSYNEEDPIAAVEAAKECAWPEWAAAQVNWLEREKCAT